MAGLWETLERSRHQMFARGTAALARTRESGTRLLVRAEQSIQGLEGTLASRRTTLNGKPLEQIEKRVLSRLETALDRMGFGLRLQIEKLTADAESIRAKRGNQATAPVAPRNGRASSRPSAKRVSAPPPPIETIAKPAPRTSNGSQAAKKAKKAQNGTTKPAPRASAKASTRWVTAQPSIDELVALPTKELAKRIVELSLEDCRALLAREKSEKKRKAVLAALDARLSAS